MLRNVRKISSFVAQVLYLDHELHRYTGTQCYEIKSNTRKSNQSYDILISHLHAVVYPF